MLFELTGIEALRLISASTYLERFGTKRAQCLYCNVISPRNDREHLVDCVVKRLEEVPEVVRCREGGFT